MKKIKLATLSAVLLSGLAGPGVLAQESTTSETSQVSESTQAEIEVSAAQTALEEAVKAFQEEYPEAQLKSIDVELLKDENYEVEIDAFSADTEYEATFLTKDAELKVDSEKDNAEADDLALELDKLITLDEANAIANEESGLSHAKSWKLESDDDYDNKPVYKVEYEENDQEAEVYIDAETGEVLKSEKDS